ncbi:MAG: hypothetical protein OXF02_03685 [Simkaniaceae bacterium]|nr:hypothetical protein [Simkaniaceae bacterium]
MLHYALAVVVCAVMTCLHGDERQAVVREEVTLEPAYPEDNDFPEGRDFDSERDMLFDNLLHQLPESSQKTNADGIKAVIERLRDSGVCVLEGSDDEIRPACVGLQCLFEEMFLANRGLFKRADFEIHTTMPSTPCCKLPDEKVRETFLASFEDEVRLVTIDGRSASLDAICNQPNATLHLTYTEAGLNRRLRHEQIALREYWEPRLHTTCIASHAAFPARVNGATYRLLTLSGNEIFFGIQATQAIHADGKRFVVHLGMRDQPAIRVWLDTLEKDLASFGRTLFAR